MSDREELKRLIQEYGAAKYSLGCIPCPWLDENKEVYKDKSDKADVIFIELFTLIDNMELKDD